MILGMAAAASCTGPVAVRPVDPVAAAARHQEKGVVRSDRPTDRTLQALRLLDLEGLLDEAPAALFRSLGTLYLETGDAGYLAAAAEIALLVARETQAGDARAAAGWNLLAASRAYAYLLGPGPPLAERAFDPQYQEMRILYARAVAGFVTWWKQAGDGASGASVRTPWETFEVVVERGPDLWAPEDFDELLPAEGLLVRGLRNRYEVPGLGAPLVAVRENRGVRPEERFYPPEGMIWPATAVLRFVPSAGSAGDSSRRVELCLYNPRRRLWLEASEERVPLAVDFTTPFAYLLSRANPKPGLLKPDRAQEHAGLFLVQRYDPLRIPIVMVHGLWSTPLAWMELSNDLAGDPELREAYQIWHFVYPTSLPYLYAGGVLREALDQARRTFDPEGDDPAMTSMVVVAHSMGGLLAHTLVSTSGMRLWDAMFTVPPEKLKASRKDLRALERSLIFERRPYIDRVIFIAVPHGGSALADSFFGKIGASLARLPSEVAQMFRRLAADNPEGLHPGMARILRGGGPVSIRALSPRHPMLEALARLPIDPAVTVHSIIGDRGPVDAPPTTDGVVEYRSAHLPGTASEVVVPSGHAAYADPQAILEIERILRLHLHEARMPAAPSADRPAGG